MKKLRILLADDEIMIREGFKRFFGREALRLNITDYILKPVNYEEFGACIDDLKIALSIAEVSELTGYGDYRVFTKVFKKTEGITPPVPAGFSGWEIIINQRRKIPIE